MAQMQAYANRKNSADGGGGGSVVVSNGSSSSSSSVVNSGISQSPTMTVTNIDISTNNNQQSFTLPELPKKRWFETQRWLNRHDHMYAYIRRQALQDYLRTIIRNPLLTAKSVVLQQFLGMYIIIIYLYIYLYICIFVSVIFIYVCIYILNIGIDKTIFNTVSKYESLDKARTMST